MLQLGIFTAIAVGAFTLFRLATEFWKPGRGRIRRRLAGEFSTNSEPVRNELYKDLEEWDSTFELDVGERAMRGAMNSSPPTDWRGRAEEYLRQAGIVMPLKRIGILALTGVLASAAVGFALGGWLPALVGAAAGIMVPMAVLAAKRKIRCEKYQKQLVGAFELIARVLRAGQTVPEAFRAATETFDQPLSGEFTKCLHAIEHGLRPEDAYRELSNRSGILELRIFVVAMTIQRQTGGNLSEVLERLAGIIRARMKLKQKMRSLTAEGRMQALTLTVLPILTFAVMYVLNRQYAQQLLDHWKLLVGTGLCMTTGVVWIRNIMRFEG